MEDNCPFCNIDIEKEKILFENDSSIVMLSNPSLIKGHCLLFPKRHVEDMLKLERSESMDIFEELIKTKEHLLKKFSGVDIKQNYRPFLPQSRIKVNHFHYHLIPRELEDGLYSGVYRNLTQDELNKDGNFMLV